MRYRIGYCLSCSYLADDMADNEQEENGGGVNAKLDAGGGFWDIFGFSYHNEYGYGLCFCGRRVLIVIKMRGNDVVVVVWSIVFSGSIVINVSGEKSRWNIFIGIHLLGEGELLGFILEELKKAVSLKRRS